MFERTQAPSIYGCLIVLFDVIRGHTAIVGYTVLDAHIDRVLFNGGTNAFGCFLTRQAIFVSSSADNTQDASKAPCRMVHIRTGLSHEIDQSAAWDIRKFDGIWHYRISDNRILCCGKVHSGQTHTLVALDNILRRSYPTFVSRAEFGRVDDGALDQASPDFPLPWFDRLPVQRAAVGHDQCERPMMTIFTVVINLSII